MLNQIIIEKNVLSTQIAIIKENEFIGFYMDTIFTEDVQNKIVVGQVTQIVKSINAVFIDFGNEKNGMLHIKQIPQDIYSKINIGSRLPVQIMKQNTGEKGHKLTAKVNLAGKFFVFMPFEKGVNISRRIKDNAKRKELKNFVEGCVGEKYGVIVRTHAQDQSESDLLEDITQLIKLTDKFMATKDCFQKGTILYEEPLFHIQIIRENIDKNSDYQIICDDNNTLNDIKKDMDSFFSSSKLEYKLCHEPEGVFAIYGIEKKRMQLFNKKVWLKNGGNLIIEYTEAMTVVDVNSAKAVSKNNLAKATLNLNLISVKESILQIILRNLSGMILVDLVEMYSEEDKKNVYEYAKELLKYYGDDRTKVYPLTELGLLQFSRTKKYQSLPQQMYKVCCACSSSFSEKNYFYICLMLEKNLKEIYSRTEHKVIFIKLKDEFYNFIVQNKCMDILQSRYSLKINLKKSQKALDNEFHISFMDNID